MNLSTLEPFIPVDVKTLIGQKITGSVLHFKDSLLYVMVVRILDVRIEIPFTTLMKLIIKRIIFFTTLERIKIEENKLLKY